MSPADRSLADGLRRHRGYRCGMAITFKRFEAELELTYSGDFMRCTTMRLMGKAQRRRPHETGELRALPADGPTDNHDDLRGSTVQ